METTQTDRQTNKQTYSLIDKKQKDKHTNKLNKQKSKKANIKQARSKENMDKEIYTHTFE